MTQYIFWDSGGAEVFMDYHVFKQRKHVTGADFSDFSKKHSSDFIKTTTLNNYSLSKY